MVAAWCVCVWVWMCLHVCVCVYTCVCVFVCMYVCWLTNMHNAIRWRDVDNICITFHPLVTVSLTHDMRTSESCLSRHSRLHTLLQRRIRTVTAPVQTARFQLYPRRMAHFMKKHTTIRYRMARKMGWIVCILKNCRVGEREKRQGVEAVPFLAEKFKILRMHDVCVCVYVYVNCLRWICRTVTKFLMSVTSHEWDVTDRNASESDRATARDRVRETFVMYK